MSLLLHKPQPMPKTRRFMQRLLLLGALLVGGSAAATEPLQGRAVAFAQPNSVWDLEWQKAKARFAEGGLVELKYFTRGERGSEEQMLHDLRRGRAQMGGMSLQGLASIVPELNIPMAPYIFSSAEEVDFVYDHYLSEVFGDLFAAKNLRLLQWVEVGWSSIYSQYPLRLPDDALGKRLRGSPNPASQSFLAAIGADSIPLGSSDLVPSLQTGLIEGGVSAVIFHYFVTRKYASHLTLSQHSYDTGAIVVNKRWFDEATPEQQSLIRSGWAGVTEARVAVRGLLTTAIEQMRGDNIQVLSLTEEELAAWRRATAHIVPELVAQIGGRSAEVLAAIEAGKRAFAEQQTPGAQTGDAR